MEASRRREQEVFSREGGSTEGGSERNVERTGSCRRPADRGTRVGGRKSCFFPESSSSPEEKRGSMVAREAMRAKVRHSEEAPRDRWTRIELRGANPPLVSQMFSSRLERGEYIHCSLGINNKMGFREFSQNDSFGLFNRGYGTNEAHSSARRSRAVIP